METFNDLLVSVIVPTYNHSNYIKNCLNSILSQDIHFKMEVIIGDDCSTDDNQKVIEEVTSANKNSNILIKLLFHQENLSQGENLPGKLNFLECLKEASGKYLIICEGDDFWTDNCKLRKQVEFLEQNPSSSLVHHPVNYVDSQNKILHQKKSFNPKIGSTSDLARHNGIITCSALFRASMLSLPDWFKNVLTGDWAIWLLLSEQGKIHSLDDNMASYRIHPEGIWSKIDFRKGLNKRIKMVRELDAYFNNRYHNDFEENIRYLYYQALVNAKHNNEKFLTLKYFLICLKNLPGTSFYSLRDLLYIIRH